MDNTSGTLPAHDSWSSLQIPNSTGMGTLSHSTNSTSNSRYLIFNCCPILLLCEVNYEPRITPRLPPRSQSVPQPVVSGRHHPHPFRLVFRLHPRRPDLPVLEGILLHGPHLVSARFLALLHVRPQPGRGGSWRRPIRELHRQADCILDARCPELLSEGLQKSRRRDGEKLIILGGKRDVTRPVRIY